ncbi:MAG: polysaccharide biosynthesis/export family protein [Sedimentisphaerales bacterium]|nr:polysaccharide biosynthesis/export family protein [Sedimentisphaerales bacterium]
MDGIQKASECKGSRPGFRRDKSCLRVKTIGKTGLLLFAASFLLFITFSSGCGNKFFDPTQVGRFRPVPAVNVILDSLGVAEETTLAWEQAEEPMPVDTVAVESDYVFMAGDVITVAIFELLQEGIQFVSNYVVTETGRISIPEVGVIEAAGLSETQLEEQIKQTLSPSGLDKLKNPSVIVTLSGSQQRAFSILGDGVPAPGRYPIPRYNFRLTDALATAGGPRQFNVSYIFVSRFADGNKGAGHELPKPGYDELELKMIEPGAAVPSLRMDQTVSPRTQHGYQWPESKVVITSSEMATDDWEAAGMPKAFEWPNNRNPARSNTQTEWQPPVQKPIGVNDILNTLEERSRREQLWLNGPVDVENALESFQILASSENRIDERVVSRRDSMGFVPAPVAPKENDEPVSVRDILKTLQERSRNQQKWLNGGVDVENARESFQELARSNKLTNQRVNNPQALASSAPVAPEKINEQLAPIESGHIEWKLINGKWVAVPSDSQAPPSTPAPAPTPVPAPTQEKEEPGHIEWKFKDGQWVPVQKGTPTLPKATEPVRPVIKIEQKEPTAGQYEIPGVKRESGTGTRLLRIPAKKLLEGDPRYNIVIKPGDTIHVPVDVVGEFCIMGHVNRPGYFNMTGRPMTLKMAIAAAGGLGPLAWPKRVEVVRRTGRASEEIVMLDLDKIASGEQPDVFIKPNDLINVGTHPTSRWRAILRNAFRATYGFGFVYDRNFADRDFGTSRPFPSWF